MELEDKKRSHIDDGMFNILIVDYPLVLIDPMELFDTLANGSKMIHRYRSDSFTLEADEDIVWTLDGEKAEFKNKAEIKIHKRALKILV